MPKGSKSSRPLWLGCVFIAVLCMLLGLFAGLFMSYLYPQESYYMLVFYPLVGLFVGLLAPVVFDHKSFKYPTILQIIYGFGFGVTLGFLSPATGFEIFIVGLIGAFLGVTARFWLPHFNF
jgi:hypothetical protein